jgi:sugar phosphate isomerase/epimerase
MPDNILAVRPSSYGKAAGRAYEEMEKIGLKHLEADIGHPSQAPAEKAKYEAHGISASTLSGRIDVQSSHCALLFEPWAAACQYLGASGMFVSVEAGDLDKRIAYGRLYECGEVAKQYGITICMETHPDLITNMDIALETIKGVDHPNVTVNYDTANIYYYNAGIDGIEELKKILDHVGAIHLKESNGKPETWYFPTFGDEHGIVDWEQTFKLLNDRGFHGPFTMEIEGCKGEGFGPDDYIKRVADSVAHLRGLGLVP